MLIYVHILAVTLVVGAVCSCKSFSVSASTKVLVNYEETDIVDDVPLNPPSGLELLPNPTVTKMKLSKIGNNPYSEFGQTYEVWKAIDDEYAEEGLASWYGTKFHGRTTSSGEVYDMYALTAAHKHLPIPCFVRVTNLDNGRSTIVKVNDRGPFKSNRILDVSYAAAVKLGFADKGITDVRVEAVGPDSDEVRGRYFVETDAVRGRDEADELFAFMQGIFASAPKIVPMDHADSYRIRLGPYSTLDTVKRVKALLLMHAQPVSILVTE